MVTMTILQNVTVIATGTQIGKSATGMQRGAAGGPKGYSTVTLEVTPKEAELLVFSELMKGRLTLVLRNPDDMDSLSQTELESVDFNDLHKNIQKYNEIRQNTIIPKRVR